MKEVPSNSLKQKLVAIKNIVVKRLQLEKEFKALHNKLEHKYEQLYKPIYEKVNKNTYKYLIKIKLSLYYY